MFGERFADAHHALPDAVALMRVVEECARRNGTSVEELFRRDVPLTSIQGIGKATKQKLMSFGLHTAEQLLQYVREHDPSTWKEEMGHLRIHRYLALGKRLYGARWH